MQYYLKIYKTKEDFDRNLRFNNTLSDHSLSSNTYTYPSKNLAILAAKDYLEAGFEYVFVVPTGPRYEGEVHEERVYLLCNAERFIEGI